MMKMLKFSRLAVLVVCIAAFASGCGGGGGGTATTPEEPPVMECPQGQVGTYPDCTDPGPTDEQRIAATQNTIAGVVTNARNLAQTASSVAAALGANEDATAQQIASALAHSGDAQTALADVLTASGVGNAATTPAAAESALADARAALENVRTAQLAVAGIQSAVNAVVEARRQREANEIALTNNSSLIKLVRDNKLLADAVLGVAGAKLTASSLNVGKAGATTHAAAADTESCDGTTAPCATYAADTGPATARVPGQRTVVVQGISSDSKTTLLTGTGPLPHGFDLVSATTYVNAYTDITKTRANERTRTNVVEDTTPNDGVDQRYENRDFPDTDYLIAGIWLTVNADISTSTINAFAYGNQPIADASTAPNFCSGIEDSDATQSGITTTDRNCGTTSGLNNIGGFVDDGKDVTATYRGNANGAYIAGSDTSYFTANVELTAEFLNPTGTTAVNTGSIGGAVTNIVAGGQSMAGSIELQKQPLTDDIGAPFAAGKSVGVVDGKSFSGDWKGQFFGYRVTRTQTTDTVHTRDANTGTITATTNTITTTYSPQAPGSVAGTFYATQQSNPVGSAAFIGSFGAHR